MVLESSGTIPFSDFLLYQYNEDTTDIGLLKISSDMNTIQQIVENWLENNGFVIREVYSLDDGKMMEYIQAFTIEGTNSLPQNFNVFEPQSIDEPIAHSTGSNMIEPVQKGRFTILTTKIEPVQQTHEEVEEETHEITDFPIKDEINEITDLDDLMQAPPMIGDEGEEFVYELITQSFPTFENIIVSSTAHVADIHSKDLSNNVLYVYEVKNKKHLTAEDVDKFGRDLEEMKKQEPNLKVIGIFVSLLCPIPKIGYLSIDFDRCFLSENYVNTNCLSLVVSMYSRIFSRIEKPTERVNYEVPVAVYKLLSELRNQYTDLVNNKQMYEEQIQMNKKSTAFMHELLAKTNVQISFVNYINNEFGDLLETQDAQENLRNIDEDKLCEYIKSTPRSKITKKHILDTFPSITRLKTMKLADIITAYTKQ